MAHLAEDTAFLLVQSSQANTTGVTSPMIALSYREKYHFFGTNEAMVVISLHE